MAVKVVLLLKNVDVMDEIYKIISRYFNTIIKTGYLPLSVVEGVFVADFIEELTNDPDFLLYATCEQKDLVKDLIDCIKQNNCLL